MTWGLRIIVAVAALLTWFAAAALYNEFGFSGDPEGMKRALVGLLFVGPIIAVAQSWIFVRAYKRANDDTRRKQLAAGLILFPMVVLTIAQLTIT